MANALEKARHALAAAREKTREWEQALDTARQEREQARQAAPEDPGQLDSYADGYARAEGKIRAAEQGRRAAEAKAAGELEAVVRAGLDDARADLKAARKAHTDHRRKLDAALEKVSEIDGAEYRPVVLADLDNGLPLAPGTSVRVSRAEQLRGTMRECEKIVGLLEQVLDTGDVRADQQHLLPDYAREFVAAVRETGRVMPAQERAAKAREEGRAAAARAREQAASMTDAERQAEYVAALDARDAAWAKQKARA